MLSAIKGINCLASYVGDEKVEYKSKNDAKQYKNYLTREDHALNINFRVNFVKMFIFKYKSARQLCESIYLPNAGFLSRGWFMRLWEGQPFNFGKFLVMSL